MMDQADSAYCIRGLASVAVAQGQPERAAQLLGAAEALLEMTGAPQYAYAPDPSSIGRVAEAVREQVGERAWTAAWERGRAMTLEQVVEYALAVQERTGD